MLGQRLAELNTTIDLVLPDFGQLRAKRGEARVLWQTHIGVECQQEAAGRGFDKDRRKLYDFLWVDARILLARGVKIYHYKMAESAAEIAPCHWKREEFDNERERGAQIRLGIAPRHGRRGERGFSCSCSNRFILFPFTIRLGPLPATLEFGLPPKWHTFPTRVDQALKTNKNQLVFMKTRKTGPVRFCRLTKNQLVQFGNFQKFDKF
jgi:hypothetical protein